MDRTRSRNASNQIRGHAMLADAIDHLLNTDRTTIAQLAAYGECGETTVREARLSDSKPIRRLRRWFRLLPRDDAQVLLDAMTDGRAKFASADPDLDLNGDGRVDTDDAIQGAIDLNSRIADALVAVRDARRDGRIDDAESTQIIRLLRNSNDLSETLCKLIIAIAPERRRAGGLRIGGAV